MKIKNNINSLSILEVEYQLNLRHEKIQSMRIMSVLGIALYLVFMVADYWSIPSAFQQALIIRAIVITGLLATLAISFHPLFIKYYSFIVPFPYLLASAGIEAMIYLSKPEDYASKVYFSGLILVIMILFAWSYLRLETLTITTLLIVLTYIVVEVNKNFGETLLSILIPNILFLGSAVVIGVVTQLIRDRYLRENFQLQRSLEFALQSKSEEANNNAYDANHDSLTGLPNRRCILDLLEKALNTAKRKNKALIIIFIDLNNFKQINDIYGHLVGDEVLKIVGDRLSLAIRKNDNLARLGGDEFLISLLIGKKKLSTVELLTKKYNATLASPMTVDGHRLKIGASIGVAAYPIQGDQIKTLMDIADSKMYQEKKKKAYCTSNNTEEERSAEILSTA